MFIYLIERHPAFHAKILDLHQQHQARGETVATSTLTLGELIAQPLRLGRTDLVHAYSDLLMSGKGVELLNFDAAAAQHYGRIRAETSLRQPDAMQMACAAAAGASTFITNDQRLWNVVVPGIGLIRGL